MSKGVQVGITGGIGAGKSLICKFFRLLGVPVYDADSMAKELMVKDPNLVGKVKSAFGDDSYYPDGTLNRQYLAGQVFSDSEKVKVLNSLVHPLVGLHYQEWAAYYLKHFPYVVKEAALMFESNSHKSLDQVIAVVCNEEERIRRVLKRDPQRSEEQIKGIIAKQISDKERAAKADIIIHNDNSELVIPKLLALHEQFSNGNL
ncbi:dephospho-CoA kinase [Limibacter armeniacum]|uniref:dephospho-CoA kinase n=1 Tax=Limibacter armeniacum TaxID=466084 RepID=UPI002FE619EC